MVAVEVGVGYNGDIDVVQDWKRPLVKEFEHFAFAHREYEGPHPKIAENEELADNFMINKHVVHEVLLARTILNDHGKPEGQWKICRPSNELFREAHGVLQIVEMGGSEVDGVPV